MNNSSKIFSLDWIWEIGITVPRAFSVKEVVFCAINSKKWIPCIVNWNKRALLACDWNLEWDRGPLLEVIWISRNRLIEILNT